MQEQYKESHTSDDSKENTEQEKNETTEATLKQRILDQLVLFVPKRNVLYASIIIGDINILYFIIMLFGGVSILKPTTDELLFWGGNLRGAVIAGELWRLLSAMFIHSGIMHLMMNMLSLWYLSISVEKLLGIKRFFMIYFFSGIMASLSSIYMHANVVSVGASGAIFGLLGALVSLLFTGLVEKDSKMQLILPLATVVGMNLIFSFLPHIDTAGHIGGFISGIIISYGFYLGIQHRRYERLTLYLVPFMASLFIIYLLIFLPQIGPLGDREVTGPVNKELKHDAAKEEKKPKIYSENNDLWRIYLRALEEVEPDIDLTYTLGLIPIVYNGDNEYNAFLQSLLICENMAIHFNRWNNDFTPEKLKEKVNNVGIYALKESMSLLKKNQKKYFAGNPDQKGWYVLLMEYYSIKIGSYRKLADYFDALSSKGLPQNTDREVREYIVKVEAEISRLNARVFEDLLKLNLPVSPLARERVMLLNKYYQLTYNHYKMLEKDVSAADSENIRANTGEINSTLSAIKQTKRFIK